MIIPAQGATGETPALLVATFHAGWQKVDGRRVEAPSPFLMLTILLDLPNVDFERAGQRAALRTLADTLLLLSFCP